MTTPIEFRLTARKDNAYRFSGGMLELCYMCVDSTSTTQTVERKVANA